ncbi:hypothetical protein HETIRDRAFT_242829, partial [Heterobasidion irregulare TC 32-1]
LPSITAQESSIVFPTFTSDTAWSLGVSLRERLLTLTSKPVAISISLASSAPLPQVLFYTVTRPGTTPDNDSWVSRKRQTVLRFGCSTWFMHCKFQGNEVAFAAKYGLGEAAGQYAIHGGGVPIRVTGVEGVVGVIIVSGLAQEDDHQVVIETV